jgi:hypothetical protein
MSRTSHAVQIVAFTTKSMSHSLPQRAPPLTLSTTGAVASGLFALTALCYVLECENHELGHVGYRIFIRRTVATAASFPEGRRKEHFPTYWRSLPHRRSLARFRPAWHWGPMCSESRYKAQTLGLLETRGDVS